MASFEAINIPQRPPMVMAGRLGKCDEGVTETEFTIANDNVFCEEGFFTEPGLIENMAQTAAAGVGNKPGNAGGPAPLGFIGGIRDLRIHELPRAGETIHTRVTVEHQVFDATVVKGEVFRECQLLASCELKIFLAPSNG